ncbi:MAG: isoprenylcysteine carboxylmethyltransferase family protein [Anaerolineales bacterium]|nr:isoprenylcysteine carboxylmethyltransferase family protein [Anaerolineales bacterium]
MEQAWEMLITFKISIFVLATGGLLYVSRLSLRSFKLHGFYRFFAWEAILVLVLLNLDDWFRTPFAPHQLISWSLLLLSLFLVIHGFHLLRLGGEPDAQRQEAGLLGLEKTTRLVTSGAYNYIRHPLYSSLLCLAWGVFFKSPSWIGGALAACASLFLTLTAKTEEAENIRYWGEEYRGYMERTKMFIPYLF